MDDDEADACGSTAIGGCERLGGVNTLAIGLLDVLNN